MKSIHTAIVTASSIVFLTTTLAQQATPEPKKEPFKGFGSSLDKRSGGRMAPNAVGGASAPKFTTTTPSTGEIALKPEWDRHVTQSTGGYSMTMDDLQALLSRFGKAERDTAAHPDAVVYEGPVIDNVADGCRVMYLTPLAEAEKVLFKLGPGNVAHSDAVMPGFPEGLQLHHYVIDFRVLQGPHYNQMTIVTDSARRVVAMQLKDTHMNWHPRHWPPVPGDWHTYDYVNTRTRAQQQTIHVRVLDAREKQHLIVANIAFGIPPPPPVGWVPITASISETSTWYLPEPMIRLALYCLSLRK